LLENVEKFARLMAAPKSRYVLRGPGSGEQVMLAGIMRMDSCIDSRVDLQALGAAGHAKLPG
jgi:hypothetical protein